MTRPVTGRTGLRQALRAQGHVDFLQVLCEEEISRRQAVSLANRLRRARFEERTTLQGNYVIVHTSHQHRFSCGVCAAARRPLVLATAAPAMKYMGLRRPCSRSSGLSQV